uniref:Uncharacterized protein n=1 Tax=Anguilla anguilla TaxID=7936 RepID=A0A0E9P9B5_ANGAN
MGLMRSFLMLTVLFSVCMKPGMHMFIGKKIYIYF